MEHFAGIASDNTESDYGMVFGIAAGFRGRAHGAITAGIRVCRIAKVSMIFCRMLSIATALLMASQLLVVEFSFAQQPASPRLSDELTKQESIYQGQGDQLREGYTIDRSLSDYARALPSGFERSLSSLGVSDRWLDVGAGRGQAVIDYFSPELDIGNQESDPSRARSAQVIAMSIEDRRTPQWRQKSDSLGSKQMQYIFGKRLRDYSNEELGQFQIITDVIGGFSYTENLTVFMEKILGLLRLEGSFYTVLQDVEHEQGNNKPFYPNAPFLTEIEKADGSKVRMCAWLKSISCVQVTCETRSGWKPPLEAYHVRKVCPATSIPPLAPVHYEAGTPPERRFRLK